MYNIYYASTLQLVHPYDDPHIDFRCGTPFVMVYTYFTPWRTSLLYFVNRYLIQSHVHNAMSLPTNWHAVAVVVKMLVDMMQYISFSRLIQRQRRHNW